MFNIAKPKWHFIIYFNKTTNGDTVFVSSRLSRMKLSCRINQMELSNSYESIIAPDSPNSMYDRIYLKKQNSNDSGNEYSAGSSYAEVTSRHSTDSIQEVSDNQVPVNFYCNDVHDPGYDDAASKKSK